MTAHCSASNSPADGSGGSARESAQNELRQKEFEVLAQKALKDLRQDAAIEIR